MVGRFLPLFAYLVAVQIKSANMCLTWERHHEHSIRFICRVPILQKSVSLFDNKGLLFSKCTYFENIKTCDPNNVMTRANETLQQMTFYVERNNLQEYNGVWTCMYGSTNYTTEISLSKGIMNYTEITLEGLRRENILLIACYSCREPYGNNAEFLVNEATHDSITFNQETGECIHQSVTCQIDICSCGASGNRFTKFFNLSSTDYSNATFSCDLIFIDPFTSAKFSKIAHGTYNGTDFLLLKTETRILREGETHPPETPKPTLSTTEMTTKLPTENTTAGDKKDFYIMVYSIIGFGALIIILLFCYCVISRKKTSRQQQKTASISQDFLPLNETGHIREGVTVSILTPEPTLSTTGENIAKSPPESTNL